MVVMDINPDPNLSVVASCPEGRKPMPPLATGWAWLSQDRGPDILLRAVIGLGDFRAFDFTQADH
jgi:hypothetical protein